MSATQTLWATDFQQN